MPFSTTTFLIRSRRETSYQGALAFQSSSIKSQVLPEPLMVRVPAASSVHLALSPHLPLATVAAAGFR